MERMLIYAAKCVSADARDWTLEYDDTDLEVHSLDGRAEIRIRPYDCGSTVTLDAARLFLRQLPSSRGCVVSDVDLGQYAGCTFEYVDPVDGAFVREHVVVLAEIMLGVTFSCPNANREHYLAEAQPILNSLVHKGKTLAWERRND